MSDEAGNAFSYDKSYDREVVQLVERLRTFEKKDAKRIARTSMRHGAKYLVAHAKQIAPVGKSYNRRGEHPHIGGTLQSRGIVVMGGKAGKPGEILMLASTARRRVFAISDSSKWYYPSIVEHGVKKGPRQFEGRRYMKRTFDTHGPQAIDVVRMKMWQGIEAMGRWFGDKKAF